MKRLLLAFVGILGPIAAAADESAAFEILDVDEPAHKDAVREMDFNRNGRIDPGPEAHAVVRYVNDTIFQKFDSDHDGKLLGDEASRYVAMQVQPKLDAVDKYFQVVAYPDADKSFAGGIPTEEAKRVLETSPFTPRFEKILFGVGYSDSEETGKETKNLLSAFEYRWGVYALGLEPVVAGTKLSYSREDTFLVAETNKVERWTVEPVRVTFGPEKWPIQPSIGLGYGKRQVEVVLSGTGEVTSEKSHEFVWDLGIAVPLFDDWIRLTVNQITRLEKLASDKTGDETRFGVEVDLQKILGFPN